MSVSNSSSRGGSKRTDGAPRDGRVAVRVGVLPREHHPPALLELERVGYRQPRGDLAGLRERAPHALHRMSQPALEADHPLVAAPLHGPVRHRLLPFVEMAFERVKPSAPELAVGSQPGIELGERLGPEPVPAPLAIRAHAHEPGLAQHPEVLRHTGLAELEPLHELAHGPLPLAQELQDLAPSRLGENGKGSTHERGILPNGYISCERGSGEGWVLGGLADLCTDPGTSFDLPPRSCGSIAAMRPATVLTAVVSPESPRLQLQRRRRRCESGKDGSTIHVRASTRITIN